MPCAAWRLAHCQQPGSTDEDRVDAVTLSELKSSAGAAADGHGGSQVVDALRHTLPAFLSSALTFGTPASALERPSPTPDNIVTGTQPGSVGACAAVVIVDNDAITCANVGDVAVVLIQSGGAPTVLSTKHCKANGEEGNASASSRERTGRTAAASTACCGCLVALATAISKATRRQGVEDGGLIRPGTQMPSISVRKRSPSDALIIVMTDGVVDGLV